jgi:hypothetical protein
MSDVYQVSYTGDILGHRRCPRAWLYERHVGLRPYEQVQAMEGNLAHFAMEWLTKHYRKHGTYPKATELEQEMLKRFSVLRSRGIRSEFAKKAEVVARVIEVVYPKSVSFPKGAAPVIVETGGIDPIVAKCISCALHTEYEIKHVRALPAGHKFSGKKQVLLRGILDLVIQQEDSMGFSRVYEIVDPIDLTGSVAEKSIKSVSGDIEIWDYKASKPDTPYIHDYVRQLLTYAALYHRNNPEEPLPARCVLAFLRRPKKGTLQDHLIAIPVTQELLDHAENWTMGQIIGIGDSISDFISNPATAKVGTGGCGMVDKELAKQCTACGQRFDCGPYSKAHAGDCDRSRIDKN